MKLKIEDNCATLETVYKQATNEEGSYDAHAGESIHVSVRSPEGHIDHYLHNHRSYDHEAMIDLKTRIEAAGEIDPTHWTFTNRDVNQPYEVTARQMYEIEFMEQF